jgi:hypothetical protein
MKVRYFACSELLVFADDRLIPPVHVEGGTASRLTYSPIVASWRHLEAEQLKRRFAALYCRKYPDLNNSLEQYLSFRLFGELFGETDGRSDGRVKAR